jgi:sarcosine oxidase
VHPEHADVVIVGGGLLGLSTAWALRDRRQVVVLERETVGNVRGGSHGPTRIFRLGYVEARYVAMAMQARERWTALESESGIRLLHPTPQLTFGAGADAVYAALASVGVSVERVSEAQISQRFPAFGGRGEAVLETTSAVIAADQTLMALQTSAKADVREHVRVERLDAQHVETADGIIEADTVVVCAGPWTRALVPGVETTPTLEHVAYLRAPADLPIFIDFTEPAVYGLPTPGAAVYKIAVHHGGAALDLDAEFGPDPAAVVALEDAIARWLPGAEIQAIDVCPYDNTTDESFVMDRVNGVVVGAGTSGHAFKFGPLLGEQLAALVLGES